MGRGFEICKRRESQGHVKVALHEITVTSRLGRRRLGRVMVVAGQKGVHYRHALVVQARVAFPSVMELR